MSIRCPPNHTLIGQLYCKNLGFSQNYLPLVPWPWARNYTQFKSLTAIGSFARMTLGTVCMSSQIVLLADPAQTPDLTPIEEIINTQHPLANLELVFQHRPGLPKPSNTAAWLAPRKLH